MPDPISWSYAAPYYAAALGLGYLLGAIPFGLVLTRLAGLGDIRAIGSGNIGATNVLRTGNKALALATLLLDGGKGAAAVLLGTLYGPDIAVLAGTGAFLGHLFPVWLKFKGGKGVATALGILLAIAWPVGILACLTWLATAAIFRFSSLAALVAAALAPVYAYFLADMQRVEFSAFLALLIFVRHHANIRRLVKGEEPRIGGTNKDA
ncbi:MAG: acyl-phosphate glycerol 3-phosphate acyltransferase [Rhodospirillaceae bacterium]|jgi:glycerol-3-phosphate acyltransferase PlsY|nr:acyl-phosphate glycerol 3-phosphate acyltransferase [Rhodospirillaceae bacterium]MDP6624385.1 glycerol-3-phosphate 1-O-acyltransferase PlsY [Alphaproteobacteria bacterium]|tara:strand:+ start:635 stop:1258 length:624 start_codon:yes stop_codon:yes gene_type:complete